MVATLGDFNALKQQMVTRASVTLTVISLTLGAAAAIEGLVDPIARLAPNAWPVDIYISAIILLVAGYAASLPLASDLLLGKTLIAYLRYDKSDMPNMPGTLRNIYANDLARDARRLYIAIRLWFASAFLLVIHVFLILVARLDFPPYFVGNTPSKGTPLALLYYIISLFALGLIVIAAVQEITRYRRTKVTPWETAPEVNGMIVTQEPTSRSD